MDTKKINGKVFFAGFIIVAALAVFAGAAIYRNNHKTFQGNFSAGNFVIIEKERTRENGQEFFFLTIKQTFHDQEYTLHVAISESIEEQYLLYDALLTDVDYNVITYEYEIPRKIAEQNGIAPNGAFDLFKFLESYELTEMYLKVKSIG